MTRIFLHCATFFVFTHKTDLLQAKLKWLDQEYLIASPYLLLMGHSVQVETLNTPTLHVEARVKCIDNTIIIRTDIVGDIAWSIIPLLITVRLILQVRDEVTKWLIENFAVLSLHQEINSFGYSSYLSRGRLKLQGVLILRLAGSFGGLHSQYLDSVKVMECSGGEVESGAYRLNDVNLDVQAYQLRSSEMDPNQSQDHGGDKPDEESPQARIIPLPNRELDGIWDS